MRETQRRHTEWTGWKRWGSNFLFKRVECRHSCTHKNTSFLKQRMQRKNKWGKCRRDAQSGLVKKKRWGFKFLFKRVKCRRFTQRKRETEGSKTER